MYKLLYIILLPLLLSCNSGIYNLSTIHKENSSNTEQAIIVQIKKLDVLTNDSVITTTSLLNNECTPKDILKAIYISVNKTGQEKISTLCQKVNLPVPKTYSNALETKEQTNTQRRRRLSFNIGPVLLNIAAAVAGAGIATFIYIKKDQQLGIVFAIVAIWFILYKNRII